MDLGLGNLPYGNVCNYATIMKTVCIFKLSSLKLLCTVYEKRCGAAV